MCVCPCLSVCLPISLPPSLPPSLGRLKGKWGAPHPPTTHVPGGVAGVDVYVFVRTYPAPLPPLSLACPCVCLPLVAGERTDEMRCLWGGGRLWTGPRDECLSVSVRCGRSSCVCLCPCRCGIDSLACRGRRPSVCLHTQMADVRDKGRFGRSTQTGGTPNTPTEAVSLSVYHSLCAHMLPAPGVSAPSAQTEGGVVGPNAPLWCWCGWTHTHIYTCN